MSFTFEQLDAIRARYPSPSAPDETRLAQMRADLLKKAQSNYLLQTYIRKLVRSGGRIESVEDALGEQELRAMSLALTEPENVTYIGHGDEPLTAEELFRLSFQLRMAVPYVWQTDMRLLAAHQPVPPHVIAREVLPHPMMWWTWDTGSQIESVIDGQTLAGTGDGVLLVDAGQGFNVVFIGSSERGPGIGSEARLQLHLGAVYYGSRFPDDYGPAAQSTGAVLGMLSFLASPYVPKHQRRMDGKLRRTLRREGEPDERQVTFVDLRSAVTPHHDSEAERGGGYRVRWMVRGHHRAQWYPSLSAHKVIWISPYIKGPEDAPLKRTVYRVVR